MLKIATLTLNRQMSGLSEPHAQGWRQRAGAVAKLLPAAVQQCGGLGTRLHPQAANGLWPVDLVPRDGHQIGALRDWYSAKALDRVAQHQRALIVRQPGQLGDRLDDANFIID